MTLKILDCTLRDGGYYNNWDFDYNSVRRYLSSVVKAGVSAIEIGFRTPPKGSYHGPFYYSTDEYLRTLEIPDSILCGVMINAADYLHEEDSLTTLQSSFCHAKESVVGLVRVAISFKNYFKAKPLAIYLKELGYEVGINLMQAQGFTKQEYSKVAGEINSWKCADVLYFADSLGSMNTSDIEMIYNALKEEWIGDLGIHAHNNKGLALSNSLEAISLGAQWCDSTIMGMGRGAGNVSTEALLMELEFLGHEKLYSRSLSKCLSDFENLREKYGWGPNPHYHFAANHNIHPTYVQSLLSENRYDKEKVFSILESISNSSASAYNEKNLHRAVFSDYGISGEGSWSPANWLKDQEVLLIANGSSFKKHKNAIQSYILRKKPFVITLNVNREISQELVDAVIVAHPQRVLLDLNSYSELECPIIMPWSKLSHGIGSELTSLKVLDYGLQISDENFGIFPNYCRLNSPLTLPYALSVLTHASARIINLVGFDGYHAGDSRQDLINNVFLDYRKIKDAVPLKALTPTSFPVPQFSIYAPDLNINEFIVVIPARFQSSRFPGKPLADLCGKSLLRHVWDKCVQAVGIDCVLVATDDKRIENHCNEHGMQVIMTSENCMTGTDRLSEVASRIKRKFYINVQGDEPLINPSDIINIVKLAKDSPDLIFNGMCEISSDGDFESANVPKVVCREDSSLLYMSRAPIPSNKRKNFIRAKRQVCIYSFPRNALLKFGKCKNKSSNEEMEDIEILRFLDMGYRIKMVDVSSSPVAVDTEEDLLRASEIIQKQKVL